MAYSRLMELASQAEKEGITLGELLARDMTSDEMDKIQEDLATEISEGERVLIDFMADVEVASVYDLLAIGPEDRLDFLMEDEYEPSDMV